MPIPNEQSEPKKPVTDKGDWQSWEFCPRCKVNAGWYIKMSGLTDMRQVCKCCGHVGDNFHYLADMPIADE